MRWGGRVPIFIMYTSCICTRIEYTIWCKSILFWHHSDLEVQMEVQDNPYRIPFSISICICTTKKGNISSANHNFMKTHANHAKKSSKFTKKITHLDDMMVHNFIKYLIQTRLRLWDIKRTNFFGEFVIFISHKRSRVWTKYFTKLFIIISYIYVIFLVNLDNFFGMVCTDFHKIIVCARYVPTKKKKAKGDIFFGVHLCFIPSSHLG